jgi:2-amino-4-hydroxy-6-hydroxymethyldihydropteridine diphosphokinase
LASSEGDLKRRAYIGLGANQGDVKETAAAAIEAVRSIERCDFVAASGFYQSAPIDADGPDYINAVVAVDTLHDPYALLLHLLDLEIMLGRKRRMPNAQRNAPRKVDLDLLLMGDLILCSTPLTLPHPRLHQRAFALRPLVELAPDIEIPGLGSAAKFLRAAADQRVSPWPVA